MYGTGIPRRTKAGIPESPAGESAIQPPSRVASVKVLTKENASEMLGGKPLDTFLSELSSRLDGWPTQPYET